MAKLASFIQIEEAIQRALFVAWEADVAGVVVEITAAAERGEMALATHLLDDVTFDALEDAAGRAEFLMGIAILFGAGQVTGEGRTTFDEKGLTDLPGIVIEGMVESFKMQAIQKIRRDTIELLTAIEVGLVEQGVAIKDGNTLRKAEVDDIARLLNQATIGTGKQLIDVGANLNTSRLVSYGFLSEAQERGLETYQITEELDGRTCPICRRMHGQTFSVDRPLARVEQQLTTPDPAELKAAWPFPSSSKAGILELEELSSDELASRGWDTPPFHPRCRGVLQRTGTVAPLTGTERTAADPISGLVIPKPKRPALDPGPVAVAEKPAKAKFLGDTVEEAEDLANALGANVLMKTEREAAEAIGASLRSNEKFMDVIGDPAGAEKNWVRALRGTVEPVSPANRLAVQNAINYNFSETRFPALTAKYGDDVVVLRIKQANPSKNQIPDPVSAAAERRVVTHVYDGPFLNKSVFVEAAPLPVSGTSGGTGGLAAEIRHEYGHHIWDQLDTSVQRAWVSKVNDIGRTDLGDQLTSYAAKNAEEAFSEALATLTHPALDRANFTDAINDLFDFIEKEVF